MRPKVRSKPHYIPKHCRTVFVFRCITSELYDVNLYMHGNQTFGDVMFLENYLLAIRTKWVKSVKHDTYICGRKDYLITTRFV